MRVISVEGTQEDGRLYRYGRSIELVHDRSERQLVQISGYRFVLVQNRARSHRAVRLTATLARYHYVPVLLMFESQDCGGGAACGTHCVPADMPPGSEVVRAQG